VWGLHGDLSERFDGLYNKGLKSKMIIFNTVICGVGGTGVIGFGMLLKNLAMPHNYRVFGSETRGSAQRGGAVTSSIRYLIPEKNDQTGEKYRYFPPNIPIGSADLLIATETSEILRQAIYLNESTRVIINKFRNVPKSGRKMLRQGVGEEYPKSSKIRENIENITNNIVFVDASETSLERFNSYVMTNYILLGAALEHGSLPIDLDILMAFLKSEKERDAVSIGTQLMVE